MAQLVIGLKYVLFLPHSVLGLFIYFISNYLYQLLHDLFVMKDYDDPERTLDPFGLGLKDHGEPHIWRCGQCSQTFSQRVLLQMHVCPQVR